MGHIGGKEENLIIATVRKEKRKLLGSINKKYKTLSKVIKQTLEAY